MHRTSEVIEVFLQPGEYFVGSADYRIRTLLGSCVSVTLWHPGRRVGAMSHFVLAERGAASDLMMDSRYGTDAIWLMVHELMAANIHPSQCHAKLFGGGSMFAPGTEEVFHVGQRNGEAARALLYDYGIHIVSESLFGAGHRQVIFDVASGDVWVRQVAPPDRYSGKAGSCT